MLDPKEEFRLPDAEKKVLEHWKTNKIFEKSLAKRKGKKTFVFYEGPPTANGRPGIHHVLARAFKDIILRYKTMRGFYVPRKAGWDTHGLPVEVGVEKELGLKTKRDLEKFGIDLFNQKAKESVWKFKDEWERLTDRMGYWLDMEYPYITYENNYVESLWWVFKTIAERGFLKESRRIVPYCPRCHTALSSHELAQPGVYKKVPDPSVYIRFRIKRPEKKNNGREYLLVWTTTPWTLPSNMFIAADPRITYTKFKVGSDFYWSYGAPPNPMFGYAHEKAPEIEAVEKISGSKLIGLSYEPVFNVPHPKKAEIYKVLPADFISTEDGTGFVHIAPAFGEDDFKLVHELYPGLEPILTINDEAKVTEGLPGAGKFVKEADADLSRDLEKRGYLYAEGKIEHEYPFCWRCGTPIIYFARLAWFFEMSRLRKELLARNSKINWVPSHLKEGRFGEWLRDAKDWAISRERYWGTPLPIWRCPDCKEIKVAGSLEELKAHDYFKNEFYLVRHTEADHIVSERIASGPETGNHISHLTAKGKIAGAKDAKELKRKNIDVIYASPYARTKELAEIIKKETGAKIFFDDRLKELNTGPFNWQKVEDYRRFFKNPMERYVKAPPGAETLTDVRRRVISFAKEINRKYRGKKIVVVGHGDPLWMLEGMLAGKSKEEALKYPYIKIGAIRKTSVPNAPMNDEGEIDVHRPYVDRVYLSCTKCDGKMERVKEVADAWFDSGSMPFAQSHFPFDQMGKRGIPNDASAKLINKIAYPADYICEAVDQTRGWFYTLLAVATLLGYEEPYKNVVCLGLIHDKKGQKMSKHVGNVVDPWMVIDKYGVDAIRWYFYTANPPGEPKNFDELEILKSYRKFHMLAYNSFVFFRTYGKKPAGKASVSTNILDRWISARLTETKTKVSGLLDAYDVREAALAIEGFTDDLSRWYIRRSRRRFQKPDSKKDFGDASATLYGALVDLTKLTAPFMPFFSEVLYSELAAKGKGDSVHLADFPKPAAKFDKPLIEKMKEVRRVSSLGLAARSSAGIKVRQPLQALYIPEASLALMNDKQLLSILKNEVNVKEILTKKGIQDIELDTNITPALKEEGLVRDLVRAVQELRQAANLSPKNKIVLFLELPKEIASTVLKNEEFIKKEIGAEELNYKKTDKFEAEIATELGGAKIWLALKEA